MQFANHFSNADRQSQLGEKITSILPILLIVIYTVGQRFISSQPMILGTNQPTHVAQTNLPFFDRSFFTQQIPLLMHIAPTTLLINPLIPLWEQCHIHFLLCLYATQQIIQLIRKDTNATCNKTISYLFAAMELLNNIFHDANNCDYLKQTFLCALLHCIVLLLVYGMSQIGESEQIHVFEQSILVF